MLELPLNFETPKLRGKKNTLKIIEWQPDRSVSIYSGVASIMTCEQNLGGWTTKNPPAKDKAGLTRIEVKLKSGKLGYFPPNRVILGNIKI
jgi:hypothetical protein